MGALESKFKSRTLAQIKSMFVGCEIIINDSGYHQGIPDTLILFGEKWAMLEFKKAPTAIRQPNQPYWVDKFNRMSFAAFIDPENKDQVLDDLQQAFGARR